MNGNFIKTVKLFFKSCSNNFLMYIVIYAVLVISVHYLLPSLGRGDFREVLGIFADSLGVFGVVVGGLKLYQKITHVYVIYEASLQRENFLDRIQFNNLTYPNSYRAPKSVVHSGDTFINHELIEIKYYGR